MKYFKKVSSLKSESIEKQLINLEKNYGISFPKLYSQFILQNEVGRHFEKWDSYLDKYLRPTPIFNINVQLQEELLSYNWLSSISQIKYDLKHYPQALDILNDYQLLRIGDIVETGGLFLGVGINNQDRIYKYSYGSDCAPILIFESIINFLDAIVIENRENLEDLIKVKGKRYYEKKGLKFAKSDLLDFLKPADYLNFAKVSSEDFLNGLEEEINDVRN